MELTGVHSMSLFYVGIVLSITPDYTLIECQTNGRIDDALAA